MNLWAHMLAELPAAALRAIARAQRISLPRQCDVVTRLARLRQALCHAATVRAVYALLDSPTQAALQQLRSLRGGIGPAELAACYGPIRPWRELAADPRPRSISEQLLLLGWLLPRPARPRHPLHYLLPPEVRRYLPQPLPSALVAPPASATTPALRAATLLLLAAAEQPLPLRQHGTLRSATLRLLTPRLAPLAETDGTALLSWLLPLLSALDLLDQHQGHASISIAGQRFLTLSSAEQQEQLHAAWIRSPEPDAWMRPLRVEMRGIDWPLLRRKLCAWAAYLLADDPCDPQTRYAELARSLGPLADAQTHGFRVVERAPWQPKRATAVLEAARVGPLNWLGLLGLEREMDNGRSGMMSAVQKGGSACSTASSLTPVAAATPPLPNWERGAGGEGKPESNLRLPIRSVPLAATRHRMRQAPRPASGRRRRWRWPDLEPRVVWQEEDAAEPPCAPPVAAGPRWRYGAPGVVEVPHAAAQAATLRLLPFVEWDAADAEATAYRISAPSLARARRQGYDAASCRQLLEVTAGPLPLGWCATLEESIPALRLVAGTVLLAENPAVLARAYRARSVQRALEQRLAPGIALVRPGGGAALLRALERQGIACLREPDHKNASETCADKNRTRMNTDERVETQYIASLRVRPPEISAGECAALLLACAHYRHMRHPMRRCCRTRCWSSVCACI